MTEKRYIIVDDGSDDSEKTIQAIREKFGDAAIQVVTPDEFKALGKVKAVSEDMSSLLVTPETIMPIRNFSGDWSYVEGRSKEEMNAILVDIRREPKIARNSLCPCNSGKKYKHCCINKK